MNHRGERIKLAMSMCFLKIIGPSKSQLSTFPETKTFLLPKNKKKKVNRRLVVESEVDTVTTGG